MTMFTAAHCTPAGCGGLKLIPNLHIAACRSASTPLATIALGARLGLGCHWCLRIVFVTFDSRLLCNHLSL
jgi:hypothetical protein